mmetsp:Transcript_19468/g.60219  ORF Transcript_19468/g.60219 Transcript_19468/m.60219 type:complete len:290 (-) Transcript_19468:37-906(-)
MGPASTPTCRSSCAELASSQPARRIFRMLQPAAAISASSKPASRALTPSQPAASSAGSSKAGSPLSSGSSAEGPRGQAAPGGAGEQLGQASALPTAAVLQLPVTHNAFAWLHNKVAMPLMRQPQDLGRAYKLLLEANALHLRVHGRASGEAVYNLACCLSLGAASAAAAAQAAGLPPQWPEASPHELAEARLDMALFTLEKALGEGYANLPQLLSDPDLLPVRSRRPAQFAKAVQGLLAKAPLGSAADAKRAAAAWAVSHRAAASPPHGGAGARSLQRSSSFCSLASAR